MSSEQVQAEVRVIMAGKAKRDSAMCKDELLLKKAKVTSIPYNWNIARVGECCSIRNDLRKPISVNERATIIGEFPYYGPTGILGYIDEFLVDGDFALIGEDGDHFLKPDIKPQTIFVQGLFNVNNHAHLIESTEKCTSQWFAIFFKHRDITEFLSRQGANRYKLNKATLEKIPILLPPIPEQKAISELLSVWGEVIEITERLIRAKEQRFNGLLCELISEQRNRQRETRWKKVRIGSFLTESRIPGSNGYEAKKITVKLYGKGVIHKDEKRIGSATTQYYTRKAGQFIYSKLDFLNGAFGIIPSELDRFESTLDLPVFDMSSDVSKEWFLYYLIRPEYYTRQLCLAKGQRKARRVNPDEFLNSKILLPPLKVQQQIADILSSAQHEIDLLKKLIEKYKSQKRGLMQRMLTGEWRVKPDVVKSYE